MSIKDISDRFLRAFDFINNGYKDPTLLTDIVGFSVQKEPSTSIIKRIKILKGKTYISLIYLYIPTEEIQSDKPDKQLTLKVDFLLREEGKLLINDQYIKNKIYRPVNVISNADYKYNVNRNEFYDEDYKVINPIELLQRIYNLHIKPTKLWEGALLRDRLQFWKIISNILNYIFVLLIEIWWFISGNKYSRGIEKRYFDIISKDIRNEFPRINKEKEGAKVQFFGLHTNRRIVIVFCILHLVIFTLFFYTNTRPGVIVTIFNNNFLTATYILLSLYILEWISKLELNTIIERISKYMLNLKYKQIKIK
jgi:hypothetical protein